MVVVAWSGLRLKTGIVGPLGVGDLPLAPPKTLCGQEGAGGTSAWALSFRGRVRLPCREPLRKDERR